MTLSQNIDTNNIFFQYNNIHLFRMRFLIVLSLVFLALTFAEANLSGFYKPETIIEKIFEKHDHIDESRTPGPYWHFKDGWRRANPTKK